MNAIVIFVLAFLSTVAAKCMTNCLCSRYKTSCKYSVLEQLPQHLEETTEFLMIAQDNIPELTPGTIKPYNLNDFRLEHTNTQQIWNGTFRDLKKLRALSLTYNKLDKIPATTFEGLDKLSTLNLSHNWIQTLEPGLLSGLISLRTLDLSYNNITILRRQLFSGLRCLNDCRENCSYSMQQNKLDLSHNLINDIENGTFRNLCIFTWLSLAYNRLATLYPSMFAGLSQVKYLNLIFNKIETIFQGAFDGLISLRKIVLDRNQIENLQDGMFLGLPRIESLVLRLSGVSEIQPNVFRNLSTLKNLHLSLNSINTLDSCSFCGLISLKMLELDESSIATLHSEAFKDLSSLVELDLSWNEIEELPPGVFEELIMLKTLRLNGNSIQTLESEVFHGLSSLRILLLSDNNEVLSLQNGGFQELFNLRYLNLQYSKMESLEADMFHGLRFLKFLDLSNNNIGNIHNRTFKDLLRLDYLDMTYNGKMKLETGALEGLQVVKTLRLHLNQDTDMVDSVGNFLHTLMQGMLNARELRLTGLQNRLQRGEFVGFHLSVLDLSQNSLSELQADTFMGLSMLKKLFIFQNKINEIEVGAFRDLTSLIVLELYQNRYKTLKPGIFQGLKSLQELNLRQNDLTELNEGVFGTIPCTERVRACLHIASSTNKNTSCQVSDTLTMLRFLDLSFNYISYIHPNTFLGMVNLQKLDLKSNTVMSFTSEFLYVPSLRWLEISFGEISNVTIDTFRCVPKLTKLDLSVNRLKSVNVEILKQFEQFEELDLDYNKLECDCELQQTWQWLQNHHIKLNEQIYCGETRTTWHEALFGLQCNRSVFVSDSAVVSDDLQFFKQYIEPSILSLILGTGLMGNGFLLYIFARHKEMRTGPNACILNLAIGDFLSLIVNLPLSYWDILHVTWELGIPVCKLFMGFKDLTVGVTVFSVVALSTQRYSITVGSFHRNRGRFHVSDRGMIVISLIIVWTLAVGFALPAFLTASVDTRCLYVVSGEEYIRQTWTIQLFIYCIIPVVAISFRYIETAKYLKTSVRTMPGESLAMTQAKRRSRVANMAVILTMVFCISYIPNFLLRVLFIWSVIKPESKFTFFISFLSFCLFFCNSCFNPIALFTMSTGFRKLFLIHIRCGKDVPPQQIQTVSSRTTTTTAETSFTRK